MLIQANKAMNVDIRIPDITKDPRCLREYNICGYELGRMGQIGFWLHKGSAGTAAIHDYHANGKYKLYKGDLSLAGFCFKVNKLGLACGVFSAGIMAIEPLVREDWKRIRSQANSISKTLKDDRKKVLRRSLECEVRQILEKAVGFYGVSDQEIMDLVHKTLNEFQVGRVMKS